MGLTSVLEQEIVSCLLVQIAVLGFIFMSKGLIETWPLSKDRGESLVDDVGGVSTREAEGDNLHCVAFLFSSS